MAKLTRMWDDCKTKEQKEQFKRELEKIDKTERSYPFEDLIFEELMRRLS